MYVCMYCVWQLGINKFAHSFGVKFRKQICAAYFLALSENHSVPYTLCLST